MSSCHPKIILTKNRRKRKMKTIRFIGEENTLEIIEKCSNDTGDYQYQFVASE
jgi:hypothetical protein